MLQKLKGVLKNFFMRLGTNDTEANFYTDDMTIRIVALFIDKVLKGKLDAEALKTKQTEYEGHFTAGNFDVINQDLQKHIDEQSAEKMFDAFIEIINDLVNDLKTENAMTDEEISKLYVGLRDDLNNMLTVGKMEQAPNTQGSLQAIAN